MKMSQFHMFFICEMAFKIFVRVGWCASCNNDNNNIIII